jgi:hypothetical protein
MAPLSQKLAMDRETVRARLGITKNASIGMRTFMDRTIGMEVTIDAASRLLMAQRLRPIH